MDGEGVEKIIKAARDGCSLQVIFPTAEPDHVYYVGTPADGYQRKVGVPPAENPHFSSLDSLAEWGWAGPRPRAWVGLDRVAVTWEDDRRSQGSMALGLSAPFRHLKVWDGKAGVYDQRELIRLLKTVFAGCVDAGLVGTFSALKSTKTESGEYTYGHSQANIGRSLEAKLGTRGGEPLPELIEVVGPVLEDPFLPLTARKVRVSVEVDPATGRFTLAPLGGEVPRALGSAAIELYGLVADAVVRASEGGTGDPDDADQRKEALAGFRVYAGTCR